MGDGPQCDHCIEIGKARQHRCQELPAIVDFAADRLVFRRHAANRIDDAGIEKPQAVIRARLEFSRREAEFAKRTVKKFPGIIAGKGPSRAVGSAKAGGKPYDQKPDVFIAPGKERGTGALCHAGSFCRHSCKNAWSRGQIEQFGEGSEIMPLHEPGQRQRQ